MIVEDLASHQQLLTGAAVLIQLASYGRPSEVIGLHKEDVVVPTAQGGPRYKRTAVIFGNSERGERTKTGEQDDTVVLDQHCHPAAARLLRVLARRAACGSRLLAPLTLSMYERAVRSSCVRLQIA